MRNFYIYRKRYYLFSDKSCARSWGPVGDTIDCRLERSNAGWMLAITNTAPHLQAADLEHLGVRFWRKDSEGGTAHHAGLGIALAFALAQAIGLPMHFVLAHNRLTATLGPWAPLV